MVSPVTTDKMGVGGGRGLNRKVKYYSFGVGLVHVKNQVKSIHQERFILIYIPSDNINSAIKECQSDAE